MKKKKFNDLFLKKLPIDYILTKMISNIGYNFSSIFIVTFLSTCKICTETSIITASISFDVADIVSSQLKNKIKIFFFSFSYTMSYTSILQSLCPKFEICPKSYTKTLCTYTHTHIYIFITWQKCNWLCNLL